MKRALMQVSTAGLCMVDDFVEAVETEPSFVMTNFTVILPVNVGDLTSSRW